MEDQLITFETAKLAKEKGFDEPCIYMYNDDKEVISTKIGMNFHPNYYGTISCPTQSLLQRWLREIHKLNIEIRIVQGGTWTFHVLTDTYKSIYSNNNYINYEEALETSLQEALKLIEVRTMMNGI